MAFVFCAYLLPKWPPLPKVPPVEWPPPKPPPDGALPPKSRLPGAGLYERPDMPPVEGALYPPRLPTPKLRLPELGLKVRLGVEPSVPNERPLPGRVTVVRVLLSRLFPNER